LIFTSFLFLSPALSISFIRSSSSRLVFEIYFEDKEEQSLLRGHRVAILFQHLQMTIYFKSQTPFDRLLELMSLSQLFRALLFPYHPSFSVFLHSFDLIDPGPRCDFFLFPYAIITRSSSCRVIPFELPSWRVT